MVNMDETACLRALADTYHAWRCYRNADKDSKAERFKEFAKRLAKTVRTVFVPTLTNMFVHRTQTRLCMQGIEPLDFARDAVVSHTMQTRYHTDKSQWIVLIQKLQQALEEHCSIPEASSSRKQQEDYFEMLNDFESLKWFEDDDAKLERACNTLPDAEAIAALRASYFSTQDCACLCTRLQLEMDTMVSRDELVLFLSGLCRLYEEGGGKPDQQRVMAICRSEEDYDKENDAMGANEDGSDDEDVELDEETLQDLFNVINCGEGNEAVTLV